MYLHVQALDTSTPSGLAMFGMLSVFSEFERSIIQERVRHFWWHVLKLSPVVCVNATMLLSSVIGMLGEFDCPTYEIGFSYGELHDLGRSTINRGHHLLTQIKHLSCPDVLETHRILFEAVYPWAGQDRTEIAPDLAVSKGPVLFAHPQEIRRAKEFALDHGQHPHPWHSCAGGGAVHSIMSGHSPHY